MKKLLLLSLLLPTIYLHAQEPDDAFLDSLPEDVRDDLLKEVKNKNHQKIIKPSSIQAN